MPPKVKTKPSARAAAFNVLTLVLHKGQALDIGFQRYLPGLQSVEISWVKSLCFGLLKHQLELEFISQSFLKHPHPNPKLNLILSLGAYQLLYMDTPSHAAIFETVELAKQQRLPTDLVNAILRRIDRERLSLPTLPESVAYNHPTWLQQTIQRHYPSQWQAILQANNAHPPLFLRVNQRRFTPQHYAELLHQQGIEAQTCMDYPDALYLPQAVPIEQLPHFTEGAVSIQDLAAQHAAYLLELNAGQMVLDACAAPGGKACHMLEVADIQLICLDHKNSRTLQIEHNLQRLGLHASVLTANSTEVTYPHHHFDRILLDAPCSGTGVIRRHPDIRFLKQETDIAQFQHQQKKLLTHLWPTLKPQGILLYATCSILPEENNELIDQFLATHPDAKLEYSQQFLPSTTGPDGFYYAKLRRTLA
jgi:16S rRNA (cytosine967-C5)-methyltransferase